MTLLFLQLRIFVLHLYNYIWMGKPIHMAFLHELYFFTFQLYLFLWQGFNIYFWWYLVFCFYFLFGAACPQIDFLVLNMIQPTNFKVSGIKTCIYVALDVYVEQDCTVDILRYCYLNYRGFFLYIKSGIF